MTHRWPLVRTMSLLVFGLLLGLTACGGDEEASVGTVPPVSEAPTTIATSTTTTSTTTTTVAPDFEGEPEFDSSSSVSTVGIDAVTFGMTISQAEAALAGTLVPVDGATEGDCYLIRPGGGPAGVELTVTLGTIERVDVTAPEITTRSGAGVGMTEDDLFALFGDRLTSSPRTGGGNTIVFTPADAGDAAFRVIFETDGSMVTSFRSGRVPQVEATAPCT